MPRRSRPSGRPSTTSPRTSKARTSAGADRRASGRAGGGGLHALVVGRRPHAVVRAARVPRRLGARARDRAHALRPVPGVLARGGWRRCGRTSSRGRAARWSRASSGSASACAPRRRAAEDEVDRLARNRNVLAALLEAALAAVYLEHGFEAVEPAVVEAFEPRIEYALNTPCRPQDRAAGAARAPRPLRRRTRRSRSKGPPHDRSFTAAAIIDVDVVGTGQGRSKKDAEQAAAEQALVDLPATVEREEV